MKTAFRSFLFFIAAPGVVAGYIPLALLQTGPQVEMGMLSYLSPILWGGGLVILVWCFWDFLSKGSGTPAPIDPPKQLVIEGLYRYVRNPMYVGVLLVIFGHFLWFGYWFILAYAAVVFTAFSTFVIFYEEPHLRKTFGSAYEGYCKQVPRWIPRFRA